MFASGDDGFDKSLLVSSCVVHNSADQSHKGNFSSTQGQSMCEDHDEWRPRWTVFQIDGQEFTDKLILRE